MIKHNVYVCTHTHNPAFTPSENGVNTLTVSFAFPFLCAGASYRVQCYDLCGKT